jgi:hypothetical protein
MGEDGYQSSRQSQSGMLMTARDMQVNLTSHLYG